MMSEKKKLFQGKFWQKLKEKAPDVLGEVMGVAADLTGIEILDKAGELIAGKKDLSPQEQQELLELRAIELEEIKLYNQDRASAREREAKVAMSGKGDVMLMAVGSAVMLLTITVIFVILYKEMNDYQEKIAIHVLGVAEAGFLSIVAYYFGSSRGSKEKQSKLENLLK